MVGEHANRRWADRVIKIKVDWHQCCPSCGTELVVDLLTLGDTPTNCPWCGQPVPGPLEGCHESLHRELCDTVRKLEAEFARKLDALGASG